MKREKLAVLCMLLAGSGCGTMPEERALSGAGIGAASGAIVGAVTSLAVGPGALIGALGGGLVGAMTNRGQVNLGEPAWKASRAERPPAPVAQAPAQTVPGPGLDRQLVARVQDRLAYLGYEPGPADGVCGPRTAAAIRSFQRDHGLEVNGLLSTALADRVLGTPKTGAISI